MLGPASQLLACGGVLQLAPVLAGSHALLACRRAASLAGGAGPTAAEAAAARRLTPTPAAETTSAASGSTCSQQPGSSSEQVLGVLSSLLQAQQQQQQPAKQSPPPPPRHTPAAAAAAAAAAFDSLQSHQAACPPDSSAASGGMVRMESQILFDACWRRFRDKRQGMDFAAPREIVWLNGAPGSGKGVSMPHILKVRGMTHAVCMSSLLASAPEAKRFIEAGEMIADATVGDLLLEALLQPASAGLSTADLNAVVDGFPRTAVQVDFVKLLLEKLTRLHTKFVDTPLASSFPRPAFKVVVLYVDEATSIQRQLQRAVAARAHNARILDAVGEQARLHQERATDLDLRKAASRYQLFKSHYSAILRLKQFLPFHLIDAMSSVQDTHEQITQELRHQSSLDLSEDAYSAIRHLPHAKDLQQTARQQLVSRLEGYVRQQRALFGRVLALMGSEVLPLLQQGALAGAAEWVSHEALFASHPVAIDMLLDVLADRGFRASYVREALAVPVALDAASGAISSRLTPQHRFRFAYTHEGGRDSAMLKALEIAARITEAARGNIAAQAQQQPAFALPAAAGSGASAAGGHAAHHHVAAHLLHHPFAAATKVTESFIPEHLDHELKARAAAQQGALKRVALAPQGQAAAAAAAAAAPIAQEAGSTSSTQGCAECGVSSDPAAAGGDGEVFVIHRCTRPDLGCGHSHELEVVTAGS